jgi:uncharacterized lipoprotein YmbA
MRHAFVSLPLAAMLVACAHTPSPTLHSLLPPSGDAAEAPSRAAAAQPTIVITSVVVPASIDRPQFVLSGPAGELRPIDGERWAEPLKRAIPRAIARGIAAAAPATMVWSSPAAAPERPSLRLKLEVAEWRSALGDGAQVEILWHLRADGGAASSGRSRARIAAADASYAALAAAHREALIAVSREIARAALELLH